MKRRKPRETLMDEYWKAQRFVNKQYSIILDAMRKTSNNLNLVLPKRGKA